MCDADDMNENDIIGVIKIKDGLFICDELGAQVSLGEICTGRLAYFKLEVDDSTPSILRLALETCRDSRSSHQKFKLDET